MRLVEYGAVFAVGAVAYTALEIMWRGHTHWSMTLTGGFCLVLLYMWSGFLQGTPFLVKCIIGAVSITAVEFAVGCIVNLAFHKNVWDYSSFRYNILGQICPAYTAAWFALSVPAFLVCDAIRKTVFR